MNRLLSLLLGCVCVTPVIGQTNFEGINLTNGSNLTFKGFNHIPYDAGDIIFQKSNGEEMARIRSYYDGSTAIGGLVLSTTPNIHDHFFFAGEGNLGIGQITPRTRLEVNSPSSNISTGVFHSNGGQAWGHTLALVTDQSNGDDPKLLFSYRNKSKHWSIGGGHNSTHFAIRENGGDGVYGTGVGDIRFAVVEGGNVGIGTETPSEKLAVNGTIRAKEIKVEAAPWPDYVFEEDYQLPSLQETEQFIKINKHLPEAPSAKVVEENGVALGEMSMLLLKKVEELTLHLIDNYKTIRKQEEEIEQLKRDLSELKSRK